MEAEYDLSILGTGDAWGRIMYQGLLLCAVGWWFKVRPKGWQAGNRVAAAAIEP